MVGVRVKEVGDRLINDGRIDRFDGERKRVIKLEKWSEDVRKFRGGGFEIKFGRELIFEGLKMKFGSMKFEDGKVPMIPFKVICSYRGVCFDDLADWFQENGLQFALFDYVKGLEGKKVLVFVPTKALALALCEFFGEKIIDAEAVGFEGDYAKEVRMDFESGFTKLVFVAGENFDGDFSDVDVVLNLLPVWDKSRWKSRLRKLKYGERKKFEVQEVLFGNLRLELQNLYDELLLGGENVGQCGVETSLVDVNSENSGENVVEILDNNVVVDIDETVEKIKVELFVCLFLDGVIRITCGEDVVLRFIENRNFEEFLKNLREGAVKFVLAEDRLKEVVKKSSCKFGLIDGC